MMSPNGLYLDNQGRIIITDTGNNRILRFTMGKDNYEVLFGGG